MTEEKVSDVAAVEGYDGPATLIAEGTSLEVDVHLRGQFQPIDGRYHWYGRVSAGETVDALVETRADVSLRTPHGEATTRLSDRDTWGRYRVTGVGRPPFEIDEL